MANQTNNQSFLESGELEDLRFGLVKAKPKLGDDFRFIGRVLDALPRLLDEIDRLRRGRQTPDPSLPRFAGEGPRRKMLVEIEVSANFERRLDNQWEVEREINADRWSWSWAFDPSKHVGNCTPTWCECKDRVSHV